tara:strand:+ start:1914 stop:2126 length:213 start_codon:yes stop_codon:yes gene_type:complete
MDYTGVPKTLYFSGYLQWLKKALCCSDVLFFRAKTQPPSGSIVVYRIEISRLVLGIRGRVLPREPKVSPN